MPFPLPRLVGAAGPRVNLLQHPQIQQNFLLIQQTPYRPPPRLLPTHPFLNQHPNPQLGLNMQRQPQPQRYPQPRANYVNVNSVNVNMSRMPNHSSDAAARRPIDDFAGFMSQKEREWLIKIQKLQLESSISDPYVEDYYAMCYNSKVRVDVLSIG